MAVPDEARVVVCPAPARDRDLGSVDWIKFQCPFFNAAAACPLPPSAPLLVLG